jgi:hypothetical protein
LQQHEVLDQQARANEESPQKMPTASDTSAVKASTRPSIAIEVARGS